MGDLPGDRGDESGDDTDVVFDVENGWSDYGSPPPGTGGGSGHQPPPPDGGDDRERQSRGEDFGNGAVWKIARMGHVLANGGTIGSGADSVRVGGAPVSRSGDVGYCLKHRIMAFLEGTSCALTRTASKFKVGLCGYTYMTCGCLISEHNYGTEYSSKD